VDQAAAANAAALRLRNKRSKSVLDGEEDAAEDTDTPPSAEDEGSLSSDRESAEEAPAKPKKSKKKQPATKTSKKRKQLPTEQSPSAEDERSSSADLQLDELVPAKLTATTKRPKKKISMKKTPAVTMGRDTKPTDLTPVQAGTYAFLAEYVRNFTHMTWPQEPPVQAFIYPGRGPTDACRALHHM